MAFLLRALFSFVHGEDQILVRIEFVRVCLEEKIQSWSFNQPNSVVGCRTLMKSLFGPRLLERKVIKFVSPLSPYPVFCAHPFYIHVHEFPFCAKYMNGAYNASHAVIKIFDTERECLLK